MLLSHNQSCGEYTTTSLALQLPSQVSTFELVNTPRPEPKWRVYEGQTLAGVDLYRTEADYGSWTASVLLLDCGVKLGAGF